MKEKIGELLILAGSIILVNCVIQLCAMEAQLPLSDIVILKVATDLSIIGAFLKWGI